MKNRILSNIAAIGFAAIIGSTPAAAQIKQTATIPFSFEAGGVEYPEGTYSVAASTFNRMVMLTNLSNGRSAFVGTPITSGAANRGTSKLVFNASGDRPKLSEVWFYGSPGMLTSPAAAREVSAKVVVGLK